jgi:hypothetical protein
MVIDSSRTASNVTWFYREGISVAVVAHFVDTGGGQRRLLCI